MSEGIKQGGASAQDRARQPKRDSSVSLESHSERRDGSKALRVRQGGSGTLTTGTNKNWGVVGEQRHAVAVKQCSFFLVGR
jgi:hypothetical protein